MDRGTRPRRHAMFAAALGLAVLAATPWPAAAADASTPPEPTPSASPNPSAIPSASPSASQSPTPTAAPTAPPTATPTAPPTAPPTASPTPRPVVIRPVPPPSPTPVITTLNLYRSSAMVRQYTSYWCVPATTQSMVNLVRGTSNRTYATQKFYYKKTRANNRYTYATLGNDPQGWAWALRYFSYGAPYSARAYTSKTTAINAIVESLARARDPVGITVRGGTHAWVVLGYRTSHDPDEPSKKTVLGFYVSGPLGSSSDMWPYRYLSLATFKTYFTRYHEWQRNVIWEGKWVVVAQ